MSEFEEIIDARLKLMLTDHSELVEALNALPSEFQEKTQEILMLVEAMKKALATVPSELDTNFNGKINKILDIASEIDKHTDILERMLDRKIPQLLEDHISAIKINTKPPYLMMFLTGFAGAVVGGITVFIALIIV